MFTLFSDQWGRNCEGIHRRELLRVGSLGMAGLTLSNWSRAKAQSPTDFVRDKSIVILNLQGGPTQIETFDPKMTAPSEYRAMFGETRTSLSGVTFGSHFPRLAAMADRLAIVRSYRHGISSHGVAAKHVMAGGNSTGAQMGSIYARIAGMTNPETGMPVNSVVPPASLGESYKKYGGAGDRVTSTGSLPASYRPFDPSAGSELLNNMKLTIPENRLGDRRTLLGYLDRFKRNFEGTTTLQGSEQFEQQAFDVILGGISNAFDMSSENPNLVERYDTSMYEIPQRLFDKRTAINKQLPVSHSPAALGRQMLMTRRLLESGCRFITVTNNGWDMHGIHEYEIADGMPLLGPAVDRAVSAFLEDLASRGMTDDVLLVITGEFGRTPRINKDLGRDHWGNLCTLAFAGGGLPMGQVIGKSDKNAAAPASDPISSSNLLGTIMHYLLDIGKVRLLSGIPTEISRALEQSTPIRELIS